MLSNTGAAEKSCQRDEQDVRKGQISVSYGQIKAFVAAKTRGHRGYQQRHRNDPDRREYCQDKGHARKRILGKGFWVVAAFKFFGKHRHEGHVECAFCKEAAEHVRQGKGNEKGLRDRPRTQIPCDQNIADKSQNTAEQGPDADREHARNQLDRLHASAARSTPFSMASRSLVSRFRCLLSE